MQVNGTKVFYILSMLGIGLTTVFLAYLFYLLFFPPHVIDIKMPIHPIPKNVRAGDNVHVDAQYCKYVDATSIITRSINSTADDNVVVPLTIVASNAPIGCGEFFIDATVPASVPVGEYRLVFSVQYQADPVRMINQKFETESFTVYK